MKLTADTITDEQIHALKKSLERACAKAGKAAYPGVTDDLIMCDIAVASHRSLKYRREARAHCAEILNAPTSRAAVHRSNARAELVSTARNRAGALRSQASAIEAAMHTIIRILDDGARSDNTDADGPLWDAAKRTLEDAGIRVPGSGYVLE